MSLFKVQTIARHRLLTDGNGVTSLVALFACPLNCKYCINMDILGYDKFRLMTPDELLDELMQDYCYFVGTNGGITLGGGEPLIYKDAIIQLSNIIPKDINFNIETSLNIKLDDSDREAIFTNSDLLIVDIKSLDEDIYLSYTGKDNHYVTENLKYIEEHNLQGKCRIRIPIIPEYKDLETAEKEKVLLNQRGFNNTDIFNYVIRDYMIN